MTGVPVDLLIPKDFVFLNFELMDWLDDREAAILLARVKYQSDRHGGWWTVTKAEMQADVRLSEWELDRALKCLIAKDCIEWVRASAKDSTRKCRVKVEATGGFLPHPVEEDSSSTPSSKKVRTSPSTKVEERVQSTESFDDWWAVYPKKAGKQAALKSYLRIVKTVDPACLLSGLVAQEKFLIDQKERGFCPDPASWLNAGRWDDEVTPRQEVRPMAGSPEWYEWREQKPGEKHDQWQLRLNGGSWD